jgi:hypothetical protein
MGVLWRSATDGSTAGTGVSKRSKSEHKHERWGIWLRITVDVSDITMNEKLRETENCEMGNDRMLL